MHAQPGTPFAVDSCVSTTGGAASSTMYCKPLRRIGRIQRHIGAARLQNPEHPDHHLETALDAQIPTSRSGPTPCSADIAPAGWRAVQLGIGERVVPRAPPPPHRACARACSSNSSWTSLSCGYAACVALNDSISCRRSLCRQYGELQRRRVGRAPRPPPATASPCCTYADHPLRIDTPSVCASGPRNPRPDHRLTASTDSSSSSCLASMRTPSTPRRSASRSSVALCR